MRTRSIVAGCVGLLFSAVLVAADPPYVGRWKVNEDKTETGPAFTFSRSESGEWRLTQGDLSQIVRFDGKDYPHPFGGLVRWVRIDDRSWETTYSQNGKVIGNAIYQLSDDGETLTTRPKSGRGETSVFRRTSGEPQGLVGAWRSATPASILEISVADGYDLVFRQGAAVCKARFDGRDYPTPGPETCKISRVDDRGFVFTVS
ncbi:MAG: hypothetical protein ABW292_05085, partial [Vicinamibacterales bacterium]